MDDIRERGYRLGRATVLDVRAVHQLERVIFPKDAYPYPDLILLFFWPGLINLKAVAPDGSLAGFVCAGQMPLQTVGWIITLGVDPAHQQRGLGRALLLRAEQRLKGTHVRLTVRESNAPAITLYRHTGYQVIDHKYGYYRDHETGLIMEKRLESD
jgi:ribosomal protein S18 acetylase RimI-like enzyme